jgi:phosphoglycerate kinase
VTVLANTSFNPGEPKNDEGFARKLADGCDLFVNDAFGSAHRAHASTVGVAQLLPAYAGLLLLAEL